MEQESGNNQSTPFKKTKNGYGGKNKNFRDHSGGQAGSWDDPYKKGLSKTERRRYQNFLADGCSPKDARQRAEERTIKNRLKRERYSRRGGPNRQRTNSYSSNRTDNNYEPYAPAEETKNNHIRSFPSNSHSVAILPKSYPSQILTPEQLNSLEEAILSEVAKGHTSALAFDGLQFNPGFLIVECKDASTASWLQGVVPRLKNCCGMELMACQKDDIPKLYSISLFLPKSSGQTVERTLSLLKAQNTGINPEIWRITSCKDENMGQRMYVDIDEGSRKAIEANGNAVNYRFGKVLAQEIHDTPSEYQREDFYRENSRETQRSMNDGCSEAGSSVHNSSIRVKDEFLSHNDQS